MKNLIIGIKGDRGEIIEFLTDNLVVKGLFTTIDTQKINENCKKLNIRIDFNESENGIKKNITKRGNISIITQKFDDQNQIQYLVSDDLDLNLIDLIPTNQLDADLKRMILQAFELTQMNGF